MNDKYVTPDDLEINRRITKLESDLTSAIRSLNWNVILIVAVVVGSTFFIYTELSSFKDSLSNFKDSNVVFQMSISKEVAEIKESFREELAKSNTRLMTQFTELEDSVGNQLLDNNRTLGELIARVDSLQSQAVN